MGWTIEACGGRAEGVVREAISERTRRARKLT